VQLEKARDQFVKRGLGVAAISYDSPQILADFSKRMKVQFPLLSDEQSAVIRSFGIFNTTVKPGTRDFGIPHPGIFIVDSSGKVTAKYFEERYQERFTPETILSRQFGDVVGPKSEVNTPHLKVVTSVSQESLRPGNRVSVIADIELPKNMHIYAPGVRGYSPVDLRIEQKPELTIHEMSYPQPRMMNLEVIKERVPVYETRDRIRRDFTLLPTARLNQLELAGSLEYQACDDQICYVPASVPFTFVIQVEPHDRQRVPEQIQKKPPG